MKAIDIQINQAKILSYSVELNKDKPEVSAIIGLFSGNKKISSFGLRTQTYYGEGICFELPADMIDPIVDISKQLEIILVRECNKQLKRLPAKPVESNEVDNA
jgi:hypothetical protein